MKIGIVTQPLIANYGCFLQNYAMQIILKQLHHIPITIDLQPKRSAFRLLAARIKFFFSILHRNSCYPRNISRKPPFSNFAEKYLVLTKEINNYSKADSIIASLSAIIVGSDQVWRAKYNGRLLPDMYLRFVYGHAIKKIAYAASFGSDDWEYTETQRNECRNLVNSFDVISVREASGISLCRNYLNVSAIQVPDPTLLLFANDYEALMCEPSASAAFIACYCLDPTPAIIECVEQVSQRVSYEKKIFSAADKDPLTVEEWLLTIRDCEYLITDSFHGCVFAIIFNKPFVCLGNAGRGNARFDTLLGTFGLEDRMVTHASPEEIQRVLNTPIDWERVNAIHDAERERGINFLKENLAES